MSEIRRTDQGGSIVTFIIVGVILAFGLIGATYFINKHGEQVRKDQAIAAADQQQKEDNEPITTGDTDNADTNKSDDNTATATAQELPVTGLDLSIGKLVGICLLTATATSYVTSRRNLTRSL